MASGSPASVCKITGRPVAAPATSAIREIRAMAASTICAAAASSPSGEASFSMRLSEATSTKSGGFSFSSLRFRSSQGSGSSYSAIVTSSRNLNRIAVPIRASERCEAVLADRISIRTCTRPCLRASAAKSAGADLRMLLIFAAEQTKIGFTPGRPAPATARTATPARGSAGSDASRSRIFPGRARKPGQRRKGIFADVVRRHRGFTHRERSSIS